MTFDVHRTTSIVNHIVFHIVKECDSGELDVVSSLGGNKMCRFRNRIVVYVSRSNKNKLTFIINKVSTFSTTIKYLFVMMR